MQDPSTPSSGANANNRSGRNPVWLRLLAGLVGLGLLWQAVQFGLDGSWPLAVFFFLLFGGVEAFVFAAVPHKASSPRGSA